MTNRQENAASMEKKLGRRFYFVRGGKMNKTAQITHSEHPMNWWSKCVGQFVSVLEVYEPTGYTKIRVMQEILEYDDVIEKPIDRYRQVEGWIPPQFIKVIGGEDDGRSRQTT